MKNITTGDTKAVGYRPLDNGEEILTTYGWVALRRITTGDSMNVPQGDYNICIGINAGLYLTNENYCVIVGHRSAQINIKGKDMIWMIDWDEPYLTPQVKAILLDYQNNFILTGKDNKKSRSELILKIIKQQKEK